RDANEQQRVCLAIPNCGTWPAPKTSNSFESPSVSGISAGLPARETVVPSPLQRRSLGDRLSPSLTAPASALIRRPCELRVANLGRPPARWFHAPSRQSAPQDWEPDPVLRNKRARRLFRLGHPLEIRGVSFSFATSSTPS